MDLGTSHAVAAGTWEDVGATPSASGALQELRQRAAGAVADSAKEARTGRDVPDASRGDQEQSMESLQGASGGRLPLRVRRSKRWLRETGARVSVLLTQSFPLVSHPVG